MMEIKYSWKVKRIAEDQIPLEILYALNKNGWNIFGIYETVKKAIEDEHAGARETTYPSATLSPLSAPDASDGRKTGENGGVG